MPQDDGVVQFSSEHDHRIWLRRSRGMAPEYFGPKPSFNRNILSLGGDIKNTICYAANNQIYLSQPCGDQMQWDSQGRQKMVINHFLSMTNTTPEVILFDANAGYYTHQSGLDLAKEFRAEYFEVNHHEAHFAAILGEHDLWGEPKVLGVIWDGQGLGRDQNVWGGEFFLYSDSIINRLAHLAYHPWILGDKMSKEPRISALCYFKEVQFAQNKLKSHFSEEEWLNYQKVLSKNNLQTSSVGRWFDAVAFMLDLVQYNEFDGQAAMSLESNALCAADKNDLEPYAIEPITNRVEIHSVNEQIVNDLLNNEPIPNIAFRFHLTLADIINQMAANLKVDQVAFSGGVFQNALLVDLISTKMKDEYNLYFHKNVSPNDENISLGQIFYYRHIQRMR